MGAFSPNDWGPRFTPGEGSFGLAGDYARAAGSVYGDKLRKDTAMAGYASGERIAGIQANAAMYPATLQQDRFNAVFPWMRSKWGSLNNELTTGGGASQGPGPPITVGPIWTPAQIQAQVNQSRATSDQTAAGQTQAAAGKLAGQGFSAGSPLMRELQARYQGQALQGATAAENDLRFGAARDNAAQLLKGETAREGQFASRRAEDLQGKQIKFSALSSLLAAISGLV